MGGRWVPHGKNLEGFRVRFKKRPGAAALRLVFLLGGVMNGALLPPLKTGYYWNLLRVGFMLKGPFRAK